MDASHFDRLARSLSLTTPGNRRRILGVLGMVPALAGLHANLDAADARKRQTRRHHPNDDRDVSAQKKRKKKKKKKCTPPPVATTCAGKCGQVTDTCGLQVNCGACTCGQGCAPCLICQPGPNGAGVCVSDAQQRGGPCGAAGQLCQDDGTCRCDSQSCAVNETCVAGACTCPCALGCTSSSVQNAINAATPGATITLCPGRFGPITIDKNLTLIGAGAGESPAANTILDARQNGTTVIVDTGATVTLQNIRITGGQSPGSDLGGGVRNEGTLTLANCVVTDNTGVFGGGISNRQTTSVLFLDSTFVLDNDAVKGGGISNNGTATLSNGSAVQNNQASEDGGGIRTLNTLTLNNSSVAGNTADGDGGGILAVVAANVTLNGGSFVANNTAGDNGGGIFNGDDIPAFQPRTTLNSGSVVSGNSASDDGGGIFLQSGFVTITSSEIADNTADIGGGIFVLGGELTVSGSALITENVGRSQVGGINQFGGTVTVQGETNVCQNTPSPQCSGFASNRCAEQCPQTT